MESTKFVVIRVDGSTKTGLGHLMRCKELALGLIRNNLTVLIVTSRSNEYLKSLFGVMEKCVIYEIGDQLSYEEDAEATAIIAKKNKTNFIITDISSDINVKKIIEYTKFYTTLNKYNFDVVVIDDLEKVNLDFKIHIIPYYGSENIKYVKSNKTKYLIGAQYYIFRNEILQLKNAKKNSKNLKKILITLGGSDNDDLTKLIYSKIKNYQKYEAKVIIGPYFSDESKNYFFNAPNSIFDNNSIEQGLKWADIIITGIGLTRYEAMLVGVPCICVTLDDLNKYDNDLLIKDTAIKHITLENNHNIDLIVDAIEELDNNLDIRNKKIMRGKCFFDGNGLERILNEFKKQNLI